MKSDQEKLLIRVGDILSDTNYKPGYQFILGTDKRTNDRLYLQLQSARPDIFTQELGIGKSGKVYLSPHMIESELVAITFALCKGFEEHECREWFKYRGRAIYGPHISVDALYYAANQLAFRAKT